MKAKSTHYNEDDMWIGRLEDYPACRTRGESLAQLRDNLKDVSFGLTSGSIPCVRKVRELVPR